MKRQYFKLFSVLLTLSMVGHSLSSLGDGGYIGGEIIENTTLTPADNPVTVFDVVRINEGVTLTIEPGTELNFMPGTHLETLGILIISGTLLNPVKCKLIPQPGVPGNWNGIKFIGSHTITDENGDYVAGSILEHIVITEASTGISISDSSNLIVRNLTIQDCVFDAVMVTGNSNLQLSDVVISNSQSGIAINDSSELTLNRVSVDLCGYGIKVEDGSKITLSQSDITNCGYGISFKTSSHSRISGCKITECVFGIMFFSDSDYPAESNIIENNELSYNDNVALFMSPGYSKIRYNIIRNNIISHNNIGLHIGNGGVNDNGYNIISGNQVFDNEFGIKISQSNDSIKFNLVKQNKIGIILNTASQNNFYGNILKENTEWALLIEDGSNNNLYEYNNIAENESAVKVSIKNNVPSIDNEFRYNCLSDNKVTNFMFLSGPQAILEFNKIVSTNDTASFINRSVFDIIATNNYWGTKDTLVINSIISDKYDYPQYGEVIYEPFSGSPHPDTPISKPRMVVKRLVGNSVVVNWCHNSESDLAGYKIYTGENNTLITNISDTIYTISGILLTEKIGVTAFDSTADGFYDKYEGHESLYSYAIAGPYAGGANSVCSDANYFTSSATAIDYQSLIWTTNGDGTFADPTTLHTYYIPGVNDKINGYVNLKLEIVTNSGIRLTDVLKLNIFEYLIIDAGPDTYITDENFFNTGQATAENYMDLLWITNGDGFFEHADSLITNYIPGENDKATGSVILTLRITSGCGVVSDDIVLEITRGFDISGTVYKGNSTLSSAVIIAYNKSDETSRAISITTTDFDGRFILTNVAEGNYYIHVIPDPSVRSKYIPTYYASSYKWHDAWLMPLHNDIYDVDINLSEVDKILPVGEGSISGTYLYDGVEGSDNNIFNKPWFASTTGQNNQTEIEEPASNHLILLMNPTLTKIIGWTLSDLQGNFNFSQLPYGEYRLWGEKAGFTNKVSNIIYITPENRDITGVGLYVDVKNSTILATIPENKPGEVLIFPNPARDYFRINARLFNDETSVIVQLINEKGVTVFEKTVSKTSPESFGPIDISTIRRGQYYSIITTKTGIRSIGKLTIN